MAHLFVTATTKTQMAQTRQKFRAEQDELKASAEMWRRKAEELERMLALKEEDFSKTVLKRRRRNAMHVDILAELSSTEDALKESQHQCAALEESLHMKLQEKEENHQRRLKEQEESVKQIIEEKYRRELESMQQKFDADLERREEAVKQERILVEEKFAKRQIEREKQFEEEILKKEKWLEQQLRKRKEDFSNQMTAMFLHWTRRAEEMGRNQKELEHHLQENIRMRDQLEEKTKEDIQRLSEDISQLQVRRVSFFLSFKEFTMIISNI